MLLFDVVTRVDAAIRTKFSTQPEIANFLLTHERKDWFLRNLCQQVINMEKRMGAKFSSQHMDQLCADFAGVFAKQAIRHREEKNLTESAKHALRKTTDYEGMEKDLIDRGIILPTSDVKHKSI
jgi:hypothetical protein